MSDKHPFEESCPNAYRVITRKIKESHGYLEQAEDIVCRLKSSEDLSEKDWAIKLAEILNASRELLEMLRTRPYDRVE